MASCSTSLPQSRGLFFGIDRQKVDRATSLECERLQPAEKPKSLNSGNTKGETNTPDPENRNVIAPTTGNENIGDNTHSARNVIAPTKGVTATRDNALDNLDEIDWPYVTKRIQQFLRSRFRGVSPESVDEFTQESLARLADPQVRARKREHSSMTTFATAIASGVASNSERKERRRRHHLAELTSAASHTSSGNTAEPDLAAILDRHRAIATLRAAISKDQPLTDLLNAALAGRDQHRDCPELGLSLKQFDAAKRRLQRRVKALSATFNTPPVENNQSKKNDPEKKIDPQRRKPPPRDSY